MNGPDIPLPETWRKCAERIEMLRQAAMRSLANPTVSAEEKRWARFYVPMLPLQRPLGRGLPETTPGGTE